MATIDINFNIPQLGALLAIGERIMTILEDLTLKINQLTDANADLKAQVEEGNAKTDTLIAQTENLIAVASTTKDALEAARAELAALNSTALAPLLTKIDAALADASSAIAAANLQDAETDAAAAGAAGAATAVAP